VHMRWSRPLFDGVFEHEMHGSAVVGDKLVVFGGLTFNKGLLSHFLVVNTVNIRPASANDLTFKLILAGNSEEDRFADVHVSTIGVDFVGFVGDLLSRFPYHFVVLRKPSRQWSTERL